MHVRAEDILVQPCTVCSVRRWARCRAETLPCTAPWMLAPAPPSVSARNSISFDDFVDSAIRQERRLTDLMRNFKPIVETYIQEEKPDSDWDAPQERRLFPEPTGSDWQHAGHRAFADPERSRQGWDENVAQGCTAIRRSQASRRPCSLTWATSTVKATRSNLSAGRFLATCAAPPWT